MSLVINTNMMAINAALELGNHYQALATSTQRLSSGLRINSAADDPAGEAVSEQMGVSIAGMNQGVRNAGDGLSMAQTADGALSVINQNLTTMKGLAEQAATGTYTTAQRLIMDSEYQAMAAEIDRIANATNFNGVSLLNGSLSLMGGGSGMKIHFGTTNNSSEDYYYINIGDMRATSTTGLRVGGGATANVITATTGLSGATSALGSGYFAFEYNVGASAGSVSLPTILDLAGFYQITSGQTLSTLVNEINLGTAARLVGTVASVNMATAQNSFIIGGTHVLITSDAATVTSNQVVVSIATAGANSTGAAVQSLIISAINNAPGANVWAVSGTSATEILYFARDAGITGNNLSAYENNSTLTFTSLSEGVSGTLLNGGQTWATANIVQGSTDNYYYLQLTGADKGANLNIQVADPHTLIGSLNDVAGGIYVPANFATTTAASGTGNWAGADILTQSDAQNALGQIDAAVQREAVIQAALGSMENRLNGTIQNLQIQGENLQAAQARITDVDVANEMTNFTTQSILTQAATAMLAQANALPRLALTLLGGGGAGAI